MTSSGKNYQSLLITRYQYLPEEKLMRLWRQLLPGVSMDREFKTKGLDADQTESAIKATEKMLNIVEKMGNIAEVLNENEIRYITV